jgi:hypothetical protein
MSDTASLTPLTKERALATIEIVARAMLAGAETLTYAELSQQLGLTKLNQQGLNSYLRAAADICAERGLPNVAAVVVSKESLAAGQPMPLARALTDDFVARASTDSAIAAEQANVRSYNWAQALHLAL